MQYIQEVIAAVKAKNSHELEFIQAVEEVLESLEPVIEKHPEFMKANIVERLCEPETILWRFFS